MKGSINFWFEKSCRYHLQVAIGLNVEMFELINEMFNKFSIRDEKISVTSSDGFKLPGKFERLIDNGNFHQLSIPREIIMEKEFV